MNKIVGIIIAVVFMTSCSDAQTHQTEEKHQSGTHSSVEEKKVVNEVVDAKNFKAKLTEEGVQIVDVRTPNEYAQGNIAGSTNIDYFGKDFQSQLNTLDKSKPVLVYCAVGGRSGKAAKQMKKMGFMVVYDLKGGYNNWPFK